MKLVMYFLNHQSEIFKKKTVVYMRRQGKKRIKKIRIKCNFLSPNQIIKKKKM